MKENPPTMDEFNNVFPRKFTGSDRPKGLRKSVDKENNNHDHNSHEISDLDKNKVVEKISKNRENVSARKNIIPSQELDEPKNPLLEESMAKDNETSSELKNNFNTSYYQNVAEETESATPSRKRGRMKKIGAGKDAAANQIISPNDALDIYLQSNSDNTEDILKKAGYTPSRKHGPKNKMQSHEETPFNENIPQMEHQITPARNRGPNKNNQAGESTILSKSLFQSGQPDMKFSSDQTIMTDQADNINQPPRRGRPKKNTQSCNENRPGLDETYLQSLSRLSTKTYQDSDLNKISKKRGCKKFQVQEEAHFSQNSSQLDGNDTTKYINEKNEENVEPMKRGRKKKIQASEDTSEIQNISPSDNTDLQLLRPNNKTQQKNKSMNNKKTATPNVKKKLKSTSTEGFPKPSSHTLKDMIDIWNSVESNEDDNNKKEARKQNTKINKKKSHQNLKNNVHDIHKSNNNNSKQVGKKRERKYDKSKTKEVSHQQSIDNDIRSASPNETNVDRDIWNQSNLNSMKDELFKTENKLRDIEKTLEQEKKIIDEIGASNQVNQDLSDQEEDITSITKNKENTDPNNITNSSLNQENAEESESNKTKETHSQTNSDSVEVDFEESDSDWRELFADTSSVDEDMEGSAERRRRASKLLPTLPQEKSTLPKDISRLDLRVGLIRQVVEHVLTRRYWIPYVQIGEKKERAAITNLRPNYERKALKGKRVLVVCNVRNTIKKLDADCIILFAKSGENHKLLEAPDDCLEGDRISVEGFPFIPDPKHRFIHPTREGLKVMHAVMRDLRVDGEGRAEYQGIPLRTEKGHFLKAETLRDCLVRK